MAAALAVGTAPKQDARGLDITDVVDFVLMSRPGVPSPRWDRRTEVTSSISGLGCGKSDDAADGPRCTYAP